MAFINARLAAVAAMLVAGIAAFYSPVVPNVLLLGGIATVAALTSVRATLLAIAGAVVVAAIVADRNDPALSATMLAWRSVRFVVVAGGLVALVQVRRTSAFASDQYRVLFDHNPFPMWLYRPDNLAFLEVNRMAIQVYGYSRDEFARMRVTDLHPEPERAAIEQRPAWGRSSYRETWTHSTKEGRTLTVDVRAHYVQWRGEPARLVIVEDITERKLLEAQLRQSQKMEAIGQLAGGVAHDFNNLLTAIRGYTDLLSASFPDVDDPRRADLQEIVRATERATALTRQLLAFSRKQILDMQVLRVSDVVQDIAPMLRRLVDESIDVATLTGDRGLVKADPMQLQQVLVNLVVNARDAVQGTGRITVETADIELDEGYTRQHPSSHPGWHVMLAVSDTGHGMDAATQQRVFEPFFTTKPVGHGTGLGLSTVYGIVKQSGGHIWVYSEQGRGTTFKVYLPVTDEPARLKSPPQQPSKAAAGIVILMVEDEAGVRKLVLRILTASGFTVHAAATPDEARALADQPHLSFQLLLTDVVLPGMTGRAVADLVTARHPQCKVLFMSGYTDDAIVRHGVLEPGAAFIQKPFTADALVHRINEVLATAV